MNNLYDFLDTCPDHIKHNFFDMTFDTFDKIILQNKISDYVYILKKGRAKVYSLTSNGTKYLDYIYGEYELFGELEVFLDKSTLSFVEALEPCNVIRIPKDSFLDWIKHDSDFSLYITIQLSQKMYDTCVNAKANIIYPLKYKLLFFILRFLTENNLTTVNKDIVIEGIGSNIRSVNRVIKELSDDNIIEYNNGYIRIKDFDRLVDMLNTYL